jgi:hypothetical protein
VAANNIVRPKKRNRRAGIWEPNLCRAMWERKKTGEFGSRSSR